MTKERKMEMSMVKAYGVTAMEDILNSSASDELKREREKERMINEVFMNPEFENRLAMQAHGDGYNNVYPIPEFLQKYVQQ